MENPREVQRRTKKKEDPCWPVHGPRFLQTDISPLCGGCLCWVGTTHQCLQIWCLVCGRKTTLDLHMTGTHIYLFKTCFIFICLSACPYVLTYNYVYVHVYLLLDQPIPAGIEVCYKRTTLAI